MIVICQNTPIKEIFIIHTKGYKYQYQIEKDTSKSKY